MSAFGPFLKWLGLALAVLVVSVIAWITSPNWLPVVNGVLGSGKETAKKEGESKDSHAGHDHGGHDDANSLELSPQGRKNIGLTPDLIKPVQLTTFSRSITVPGIVVGLPGKSKIQVVAPTTGIINEVYPITGSSVVAGQPLFKMRLLHEDLLQGQTEYLKTLGELDVEKKEIKRLEGLTKQGIVAEKELLERQYAKHKLEAVFAAQQESLLLHGLTEKQVQEIGASRKLISEFVIKAPALSSGQAIQLAAQGDGNAVAAADNGPAAAGVPTQRAIVQDLKVSKGSFVAAGATLCELADLRNLYVQGQAFEQDGEELVKAISNGWKVTAVLEDKKEKSQIIEGLSIAYLDSEVESESRALHFYVELPNKIIAEKEAAGGHHFVSWKFKPGQRMQLQVPVEKWDKRIVLPVDAVAQEGPESFVFVENGGHFDRKPVHIEYKDQLWAVIGNDGALFPGDRVAMTAAHQMLIALKNKAGGGVDPHAGHNH